MTKQTLTPDQWEARYQDNDTPWIHHGLVKELIERIPDYVSTDANLVDLGCGHGFEARAIANLGINVLGVDISKTAIHTAQSLSGHLKNLQFSQGNIVTMPRLNCDAIVEVCVLHTNKTPEDRERFIQALHSHLKPGGYWFHVSCKMPDILSVAEQASVSPPPGLTDQRFTSLSKPHFKQLESYHIDYTIKRQEKLVAFPSRFCILQAY